MPDHVEGPVEGRTRRSGAPPVLESTTQSQVVLVVSDCPVEQERLGTWLEEASYEVLMCPGPTGPDGCVQVRGLRCALAAAADVVLLDLPLRGDLTAESTPTGVLLRSYLDRGSSVVVVSDDPFANPSPGVEAVAGGGRALTPEGVCRAVRRAAERDGASTPR